MGRCSFSGRRALLFEAADEVLQHQAVEGVLQVGVLDAGVEVGVVVHLDHLDAVADLLEVDAIEPVADQVGGLERQFHDRLRRALHRQGAAFADDLGALGLVVDDLPVPLDMKYWQAKIGRRLRMPMRQSYSVKRNSWASSSTECSNSPALASRNCCRFSTLITPREKQPSGIFSTSGKPRRSPTFSSSWGCRGRGSPWPACSGRGCAVGR